MSLQWSTYNTLFHSERYGRFCYNALSNTLIELDEIHYGLLEVYLSEQAFSDTQGNGFWSLMREKLVLVEPGEEENLLLVRQYRRQLSCFDTSTLGLTICPTLRCNFRCPYCYELNQQDSRFMSAETQERLISWIKDYKSISTLSVAWYGGEPLLAFDIICALTERFQSLGLAYEKASLVTNGYLLDREKIRRLNDLKIDFIQITLDGSSEIHDTRRILAGGGPTFARILENVEALMNSDWVGVCNIRVSIDKHNIKDFLDLRTELLARFRGKKLFVYPGRVDVLGDQDYDSGCCLDSDEWSDFTLELARCHGIFPAGRLHPRIKLGGTCVALRHQSFVLGPDGELYKCWNDVGRPTMVVGSINDEDTISHPILRAQYATGVDPYRDPECRTCAVLPICGGGCAHRRLLAKYLDRKSIEYCSPYRTRLRDYLEGYIDTVRTQEICATMLQPGAALAEQTGYRVISLSVTHSPKPSGEQVE